MDCTDKDFCITVLETSDVHGCILPINYANNEKLEAGFAKISNIIKREREENENLILVDNGDVIQGTPLTYFYSRIDSSNINPVIKVMNYFRYDAAVVGNHEFNYGQDIFMGAVKASEFPWLSANITGEDTSKPFYGKPYIIKEFGNGFRAAVLGLTTNYIPNWENPGHIEGLKFGDAVEYAEKWVKYIKEEERADLVILSYHGGFERDIASGSPTEKLTGENEGYEICMKVPGIDILLTGHQHRLIAGTRINGVLVMQPGYEGAYIGKVSIKLTYHRGWKISEMKSELIKVEGLDEDPHIEELIRDYETRTQKWLDTPIGKINGDMTVSNPESIRLKDNPLIEFFNKVQMESAKVDISAAALFYDKAPGLKSDVTMRDIVANYIYPNTLRVIRVKGQDIKDALERSASYFEIYNGKEIKVNKDLLNSKFQPYNYDMWEGIEYKINVSKPLGSRVENLKYKGNPLDMAAEFDVVMNNYRAGGGGEYHMFKGRPVVKDVPTDVSELIANYILDRKTIDASVNNNWEVIHN